MKKEEILMKAVDLVSNSRQESHGDTFKNHEQIAEFWNTYLDGKLKPMSSITPDEAAMMLGLVKVSRSIVGKHNIDDYIDGAAYMAIAGELKIEDDSTPKKSRGEIMGEITRKHVMKLAKEGK
jgi:hypothetical protein